MSKISLFGGNYCKTRKPRAVAAGLIVNSAKIWRGKQAQKREVEKAKMGLWVGAGLHPPVFSNARGKQLS
jgi:hypothetical protein